MVRYGIFEGANTAAQFELTTLALFLSSAAVAAEDMAMALGARPRR